MIPGLDFHLVLHILKYVQTLLPAPSPKQVAQSWAAQVYLTWRMIMVVTGICFLAGRGMVPQGLFYYFPDRDTANYIQIFSSLTPLPLTKGFSICL